MMDPEDLQSDLLALRRLYGLLVKDEHYVEDAGFEHLDDNTRRLLINLLDPAANKAFDAHAKILDTQFKATYSSWSTPQGQPGDILSLKSFSVRNAPSLQNVDLLTGQGALNEPMSQLDLAGELGSRMKRCRVCQKPKVKQLTKEISFRDTNNILQNHKRRWEVENEPSTVGSSLDGPFFSILTDQEDHISREASTKILQLESCISSLQVAVKHANFLKSESVNEDKGFDPNSSTSLRIWKPRDTGQQWREQSLVNTMLPSSQIISQQVEEPVVKRTETFNPIQNKYDDTPDEAYYLFHKSDNSSNVKKPADENRFLTSQLSKQCEKTPVNTMLPSSQITSQQVEEPVADKIEMFDLIQSEYDNIPDEAYYPLHSGGNSSNIKTPVDKNQSLHGNLTSQMNRQQLGQLQMAKPEALVNTMLPSSRITSQQVVQPVADKTEIFNPRQKQYDFDKGGNSSVATKPADKNRVLNRQQVDQLQKAKTEALVNTMLPSSQVKSQLVEEPVADKIEMLNPRQNKYDNIPNVKKPADKNQFLHSNLSRQMSRQQLGQSRKAKTEALVNTVLPSSQVTSQQVVGQSQKAKTNIPPEKNRFLHRNVSSQTSRQQLDQFQMAKTEAVGSYEITEWQDPLVGYGKPSNEQQKAKPSKTYTDQMDYYRGKHDAADSKRSVSVASKRILESPVSSSNYATQVQSPSQSQSPSPSYHSLNDSEGSLLDHREVYSESSGSEAREKSETELSLVLSQYQGPNKGGSFESCGSMSRKMVPKKGHERGDPKESNRKLENKRTTVSSRDQSPYRNSSSNESSRSNATEMVPKQGHKNSIPKEPKRKDESKDNTVLSRDQISSTSSRSHESSGSESGRMVPIKVRKGNKKELKRSSSNEYSGSGSGSGSGRMDPKKGHLKANQKELERSESGSSNEFSGSGSESGSGSGSESGSGSGSLGSRSGSVSGSGSGSGSRSGSGSQSGSGSRSGSGSHSVSGSESGSGSGSGSATRQRERKGKEKESDMNTGSSEDQGSYTGSSSNESSRSSSSKTDQKEPEKNQGWRLGKLKDKLAVIFHHHHHHHHHNGEDDNDHDENDNDDGSHKDNYKKAWKQTKKIIGHSSKTGAHAAKIIGKETKKIIGHGSKTGAHAAVIIGKETKKIIGHGSKTGAHAAVIIGKETKKIIGHGSKTGAHAAKIIGKETKKIIGHGSKTGAHAAKIIGKQALVYEAHAEHAVRKMASTAVKKIEKKALEAKKHKHHDSHAAKKSESRGLGISQAHGEHAVHDSKALVVVNDHEAHGSHEVKDESRALVLVNDGGHSDHSVKKNENLALVLVNDGGHGSHSVKNESKALVLVKDAGHGSHAVKTESKTLVVHKSVGKKPKAQLQSLVGGLLKPSQDSTKSSKSKSATKGTSGASSSAKKQGSSSSSGGGNLKNNIAWLKMLKQKRRLERMEKLRRKVGTGKKS